MGRGNIGGRSIFRIRGNGSLQEMRPEREWTLSDGLSTTRKLVGPAERVSEAFSGLVGAGSGSGADRLAETYQGQKGELIVRVAEEAVIYEEAEEGGAGGNVESVNAVWELVAREIFLPIESHPDFDAIVAERKRVIEKAARDATAPETPTAAEKKLYAYYSHNVLDYVATDLMLMKTTTLSNRSEIVASYDNLNTVVGIGTINPPSTILGALGSLPKPGGEAGAWEWLMLGPQIRQVTGWKFTLSYRWHGAARWAEIYGGTWTPLYEA